MTSPLINAKRRYAQGGTKSLQMYLKRWRTWVHAGLPFNISGVDEVIASLEDSVMGSIPSSFHISQNPSLVGNTKECWRSLLLTSSSNLLARALTRLVISESDGALINLNKGISKCIKQNFSRHRL